MKYVLFLLLATLPVYSQTHQSLKTKYGGPISETFQVRPDITATVFYSSSGTIKSMRIGPNDVFKGDKHKGPPLAKDRLVAVIDELVPKKNRGKFVMGSFLDIMCPPENKCGGTEEEYEKLTIVFNGNDNAINWALVTWKDVPGRQQAGE